MCCFCSVHCVHNAVACMRQRARDMGSHHKMRRHAEYQKGRIGSRQAIV